LAGTVIGTIIAVAHIVRNNIYLYGIRGEGQSATHRAAALMSQKCFDANKIHTRTFGRGDLPTALRYSGEHIDDAIKAAVTSGGDPDIPAGAGSRPFGYRAPS
jgi:L-iditol 2-dehydrogenase